MHADARRQTTRANKQQQSFWRKDTWLNNTVFFFNWAFKFRSYYENELLLFYNQLSQHDLRNYNADNDSITCARLTVTLYDFSFMLA